jgi:hypothetical protein
MSSERTEARDHSSRASDIETRIPGPGEFLEVARCCPLNYAWVVPNRHDVDDAPSTERQGQRIPIGVGPFGPGVAIEAIRGGRRHVLGPHRGFVVHPMP